MKIINTPRLLENLMKRISLLIVTLAVASGAALADSNLKSGLGGALGGAGGAAVQWVKGVAGGHANYRDRARLRRVRIDRRHTPARRGPAVCD